MFSIKKKRRKNAKVSPVIIAFQNENVLFCILIVWSVDEFDDKFGLPGKESALCVSCAGSCSISLLMGG